MRFLNLLSRAALSGMLLLGLGRQGQAAPAIKNLSLRGLQIGGTTSLTIEGSELGPDTQIVLPVPIAKQQIKPSATDDSATIEIALDPAAVPGIYPLRVANARGISDAVLVGVDVLAERTIAAEAGTLPVAMTGAIFGWHDLAQFVRWACRARDRHRPRGAPLGQPAESRDSPVGCPRRAAGLVADGGLDRRRCPDRDEAAGRRPLYG